MPFRKIKNNALYDLKYGLIDNAKRLKKTAIELKDLAGRSMLYLQLAEYGVEIPKDPDALLEITELDLSNKVPSTASQKHHPPLPLGVMKIVP